MNKLRPFGVTNYAGIPVPANPAVSIELVDTDSGLLLNRLTTGQRDGITGPPAGLVVYNTDDSQLETFDGSDWIAGGVGGQLPTYTAVADTAITITAGGNVDGLRCRHNDGGGSWRRNLS